MGHPAANVDWPEVVRSSGSYLSPGQFILLSCASARRLTSLRGFNAACFSLTGTHPWALQRSRLCAGHLLSPCCCCDPPGKPDLAAAGGPCDDGHAAGVGGAFRPRHSCRARQDHRGGRSEFGVCSQPCHQLVSLFAFGHTCPFAFCFLCLHALSVRWVPSRPSRMVTLAGPSPKGTDGLFFRCGTK